MQKLIIASTRASAGKTSVITGLLKNLGKPFGYIKPLGDRLVYKEKHLWDYDFSVVSGIFGRQGNSEETTIGFQHSKLRYMYDEEGIKAKLKEIAEAAGKDKELLVIEGGRDFSYGASVHLDALSVAKSTGAKFILVVSGNEDAIVDDLYFYKKHIHAEGVNAGGMIINKVPDIEDFKDSYLSGIQEMGAKILGIIPFRKDLTYYTVEFLADALLAKVIAGEKGIHNIVKNVFVGAMSMDDAVRSQFFKKENRVMITAGDRSDLILAALETDATAIILTNNISPPSNITSLASMKNIPLLMATGDTYTVASQIDDLEPLLTASETEKIDLLAKLVKTHVNIDEVMK
jgi:uncharacterized protein